MPRNGSGTYSLPAGNPVTTATTISSTTQNSTMADIATALTQSVSKDGQTTMSGPLAMGGQAINNAGAISATAVTATGAVKSGTTGTSGSFQILRTSDGAVAYRLEESGGAFNLYNVSLATASLAINGAGNVTVAAPSSGATITLTGLAGVVNQAITQGNGGVAIRITDPGANATTLDIFTTNAGGFLSPSGTAATPLTLRTNGADRLTISSAGNVTVSAPSSNVSLTVNGVSTNAVALFNGGNSTSSYVAFQNSGATIGNIGSSAALLIGGSAANFSIASQGAMELGVNGTSNALSISTAKDITARGVSICKFKAADQSKSANITPDNDTDLAVTLAAGTYAVECMIHVTADGTSSAGGIRWGLNFTGTTSANGTQQHTYGLLNSAVIPVLGGQALSTVASAATFVASTVSFTSILDVIFIKAIVQATGSGTLGFNWAQNTSTGGNLTVVKGSYMTVTQLS